MLPKGLIIILRLSERGVLVASEFGEGRIRRSFEGGGRLHFVVVDAGLVVAASLFALVGDHVLSFLTGTMPTICRTISPRPPSAIQIRN